MPLLEDYVKFNYDGVVVQNTGQSGICAKVLCDHTSRVLCTYTSRVL